MEFASVVKEHFNKQRWTQNTTMTGVEGLKTYHLLKTIHLYGWTREISHGNLQSSPTSMTNEGHASSKVVIAYTREIGAIFAYRMLPIWQKVIRPTSMKLWPVSECCRSDRRWFGQLRWNSGLYPRHNSNIRHRLQSTAMSHTKRDQVESWTNQKSLDL